MYGVIMEPEYISRTVLSRVISVVIVALTSGVPLVSAAVNTIVPSLPGAGTLGNELRQEKMQPLRAPERPDIVLQADATGKSLPPPDSGVRVTVRKVIFIGMPEGIRVTKPELQKLLRKDLNRPVSFAELQQMAEKVTAFYRQKGFLLAHTVLPPQTVRGGVLTLKIIPGRFDSNNIMNQSLMRDSMLQRIMTDTIPEGDVISRRQLERLALLLNDTPGVRAQVTLQTGKKPGTATVNVTTSEGKRVGGYVGTDNQGSRTTGRGRLMGGIYANELLRTGDQLRTDVMIAYEHGDMINGSMDYSSLINGYGTRVGAGYSHLDYQYTFRKLDFSGYSDNWNLYLSHPWLRTGAARFDVRLEGGQQLLTDKYPSEFSANNNRGRKNVNYISGGLSGSVASLPGGVTGLALSFTTGQVDYRNDTARFWNGADIRGTGGQFSRFNYQLQHEQQVAGPFSLYGSVTGQLANQNLDASQKLLLGGPSAVRAYDVGDGAVDNGTIATLEVRSRWALPSGRIMGRAPALTFAPFYDQAWGQQNRDNTSSMNGQALASRNHFRLAGVGVSVSLADSGNYAVSMTWARRTTSTDPVSGNKDKERFWLSAVKTF
ncbi:ShlB/FhaC/HecB family hemolysin secretion/activation protein [Escherichia coli]|nr:ShlB/FhaC/HecB family hemolysin secretion/activation protein [Escherichia coli]EHW7739125.1 ShlB/FhaC/HecB family hemolysin secretion/activation protein [Escherichia coli]EJY0872157.1 ShlB/FhaC/HecB family hemolysin secretion/activation protein [Escherichia coli]